MLSRLPVNNGRSEPGRSLQTLRNGCFNLLRALDRTADLRPCFLIVSRILWYYLLPPPPRWGVWGVRLQQDRTFPAHVSYVRGLLIVSLWTFTAFVLLLVSLLPPVYTAKDWHQPTLSSHSWQKSSLLPQPRDRYSIQELSMVLLVVAFPNQVQPNR
jgi:hypothetical protein